MNVGNLLKKNCWFPYSLTYKKILHIQYKYFPQGLAEKQVSAEKYF